MVKVKVIHQSHSQIRLEIVNMTIFFIPDDMDICLLDLLSYDSFYSSRNVNCNLVKSQLISVIFFNDPVLRLSEEFWW